MGIVDSKGHLYLKEDPEVWIKNNPASRLALVTSFRLNLENGVEEIAESIGELTHLIHLVFRWCRSLKRVPNAITRLHKLEHLLFHSCSRLEELPANIGNLVSLTHLQLSHCEDIKFLPNSIVNLSKLTSLTLCHCVSLVELPANIGQLASLTHLKLSSCRNIKSLLMSVANLPNLTSLSLSSLSLSEIPYNLGDLKKSLTRLDLSYCNNIEFLPNNIANLSNLTSLSLICCNSLIELPSNLGQLKSLSYLELYYCNKIKSLPDSIKDLCSLDTLIINCCDSLTHLPINLNVLHLKLLNFCPRFLPNGLINLKYLRVNICSCSDESFVNWKDPYSLQHLAISSCFSHCNYILKVPASLNQFVNLQVLSLHYKKRFVELPANLVGLAHLCLLDIQHSSISCLPWSITKLRRLRHLMLPKDFRLETLSYELNISVIISVNERHVRKTWEELKTEIGQLPIPFGGEITNDAAQNPSIMSHPGYLWLKENPSQWIINNRNLLKLVRFLDLEYVELTDSIMQFSELTHLCLDIAADICLPDNYFVTFTRLTHLSLHFFSVGKHKSITHSLSKLSNLQTLHLHMHHSVLLANFNMPVSLKYLSLSYCNNMRPLYDSLEKLTNLKTLDLYSCV
ncbi:disease resistance protein TAO1-like [Chenopodium quinoa]|uniref:disease resistance protein TAO1-like n=1 Tax=Chenopodium quinoa TaxID=63459 RepID=UPI000B774D47|nr:disease resistance protein TAO1-like [Chenopodium quinoa]XP_021757998.1 disease resistance protein TAO1-like [Chenopodium quinoa]